MLPHEALARWAAQAHEAGHLAAVTYTADPDGQGHALLCGCVSDLLPAANIEGWVTALRDRLAEAGYDELAYHPDEEEDDGEAPTAFAVLVDCGPDDVAALHGFMALARHDLTGGRHLSDAYDP
jgi:hypothetical protein